MVRLTEQAIERWRAFLAPGAAVIDATAGNGHDALALANCLGHKGLLLACDCQDSALAATAARLRERKEDGPVVEVFAADHARLAGALAQRKPRPLHLAVFNLGYLPGGDHAVRTTEASTLMALAALLPQMAARAAFSVMAYRGHPGGMAEAAAIEEWAALQQKGGWRWERHEPTGPTKSLPPVWHWLERG